MISEAKKKQKKIEIMEKSFARYCETGLRDTGIKDLAEACGMTAPNFYSYFDSLDQLIIEATEHCMIKIENEIMVSAPKSKEDIFPFIDKMFDLKRDFHPAEYRFMYQVFTTPRFHEFGKTFRVRQFERYRSYAEMLEPSLGVSWYMILQWILSLEQAINQFALFENATMFIMQKIHLQNMARSMLKVKLEDLLGDNVYRALNGMDEKPGDC